MLEISDVEFGEIRDLMFAKTGVFLKDAKKPLVLTRLRKRVQELALSSFMEYVPLLKAPNSSELEFFINALTTNETFFFRHGKQFEYLKDTILPGVIAQKTKEGKPKEVRIWSGASSTGEEPYSLAILCREFFLAHRGWKVTLIASDVNSSVLDFAKKGIYPERSLRETDPKLAEKYFKPIEKANTYAQQEYVLSDDIKRMVVYQQHNLLTKFSQNTFDVIFLRNVLIYFTRETKEQVITLLQDNVVPGGHLVISLSESLSDVKTKFHFLKSGIYQRKEA